MATLWFSRFWRLNFQMTFEKANYRQVGVNSPLLKYHTPRFLKRGLFARFGPKTSAVSGLFGRFGAGGHFSPDTAYKTLRFSEGKPAIFEENRQVLLAKSGQNGLPAPKGPNSPDSADVFGPF